MSKFKDKALHSQAVSKAKRKFKVWPSAYASGYVVQEYKRLYKKKHGSLSGAFRGDDLGKWFKENWVRIGSTGKIMGPCGGRSSKEGKPKCLPKARAQALSAEQRRRLVSRKRSKDPNPNRRGKAIMTSSKPSKDAAMLGGMLNKSPNTAPDRSKVRARLKKLMDAYRRPNSY